MIPTPLSVPYIHCGLDIAKRAVERVVPMLETIPREGGFVMRMHSWPSLSQSISRAGRSSGASLLPSQAEREVSIRLRRFSPLPLFTPWQASQCTILPAFELWASYLTSFSPPLHLAGTALQIGSAPDARLRSHSSTLHVSVAMAHCAVIAAATSSRKHGQTYHDHGAHHCTVPVFTVVSGCRV